MESPTDEDFAKITCCFARRSSSSWKDLGETSSERTARLDNNFG